MSVEFLLNPASEAFKDLMHRSVNGASDHASKNQVGKASIKSKYGNAAGLVALGAFSNPSRRSETGKDGTLHRAIKNYPDMISFPATNQLVPMASTKVGTLVSGVHSKVFKTSLREGKPTDGPKNARRIFTSHFDTDGIDPAEHEKILRIINEDANYMKIIEELTATHSANEFMISVDDCWDVCINLLVCAVELVQGPKLLAGGSTASADIGGGSASQISSGGGDSTWLISSGGDGFGGGGGGGGSLGFGGGSLGDDSDIFGSGRRGGGAGHARPKQATPLQAVAAVAAAVVESLTPHLQGLRKDVQEGGQCLMDKFEEVEGKVESKGEEVKATVESESAEVKAKVESKGEEVKAKVESKGEEVKAKVGSLHAKVDAINAHLVEQQKAFQAREIEEKKRALARDQQALDALEQQQRNTEVQAELNDAQRQLFMQEREELLQQVDACTRAAVSSSLPPALNQSLPPALNQSLPAALNQSLPAALNQSLPAALNQSLPAALNETGPDDGTLVDFDLIDVDGVAVPPPEVAAPPPMPNHLRSTTASLAHSANRPKRPMPASEAKGKKAQKTPRMATPLSPTDKNFTNKN